MLKKVLNINGLPRTLIVDNKTSLASVLREQLLLTGCKVGCNQGQCGACSIVMDGEVVRSCIVKMKKVPDDAKIWTIEGIGTPENLHPLQVAWIAYGCAQCGFCSPGFIMSAKVLLERNPNPHQKKYVIGFKKPHLPLHRLKDLVDAVNAVAKVRAGKCAKRNCFTRL